MNWFSPSQRYFLFTSATDMRKGFDGLCALVSGGMGRDVLCGEVFIFVNRVKLPVWNQTGFVVCCKRL
jgi:hypothetical protein